MQEIKGQPVQFVPDWLKQQANRNARQVAIESPDGVMTYQALYDAACEYAASLRKAGVLFGDRVALLARSGYQYVLMLHSVMQLGAIAVPINWRLTPREIAVQLSDCEASLLLHDDGMTTMAADIVELFQPVHGVYNLEQLPRSDAKAMRDVIHLCDIHALIYTSGTTGRSKGAMITYQNHFWGAMASALQLGLDTKDRWLVPMPLFHVGGMGVLMRSLIYGTTVVMHNGFDEDAVNRALDEDEITLVSVVPAMLQRMLNRRNRPYSPSLRSVLLGGSAAPKPLLERALALSVPINQSYGMTETNTQITTLQSRDALRKVGSSGKPLANAEVAIWDGAEMTQRPHVEGEIVVKGPTVVPGYFRRPDATAKAFVDGWFHTGDIGVFDDEGYLYVLDRRADLIVSGGENVYPAEIESVLTGMNGILEAAVVGKEDEQYGQVPVAFVVCQEGASIDAQALQAQCRQLLAGYKVPKAFIQVDTLPRNASGKLLRRVLKERVSS